MPSSRINPLYWLALVVAIVGIYATGLHSPLVFDDARLTDGTVYGHFGSLFEIKPRLLSYGSFVWIQSLFGENLLIQRAFNVLIHIAVVFAIFQLHSLLLARTEFPAAEQGPSDFQASVGSALRLGVLIFALNPVAVYAVAYLIQRSILLATLFVVLSAWSFAKWCADARFRWLILAFIFYVVAVLSKETSVLAIGLGIPLYVFVKRPSGTQLLRLLGVVAVGLSLVGTVLFSTYGHILGTAFDETSQAYLAQLETQHPGFSRWSYALSVLNQASLFFHYGSLWLFPNVQWMSVDIRPTFPLSFASPLEIAGAIAFVLVLIGCMWAVLRRSDALGYAALCLLFPLVLFFTEFLTVWLQDPFVLYRSYLWAIGIPGLVAVAVIGISAKTLGRASLVVGLILCALTFERVASFSNELSLWSDAAEKIDLKAPPQAVGRWRPFQNRGAYHLGRGNTHAALEDFKTAEALGEPLGSAAFSVGQSEQLLNRHAAALNAFARAQAKGFNDPALSYHKGESLFSTGRYADAFQALTLALEKREPGSEVERVIRTRRAEAAVAAGQYETAISDYQALLPANSSDPRLSVGLGMALVGAAKYGEANALFDQMIKSKPNAGAFYGRAMASLRQGNKSAATRDIEQAAAMEPNNPQYSTLRDQLRLQK